jgi:site-specific recombinase XerD
MITDRPLIDEFIQWLDRIRSLTEMTVAHMRNVCRSWADFLEERKEKSLRSATTESVLAYVEKRHAVDQVKDVTISDDLCILRTFYEYLVNFGGSTNPTACLPEFVCRKTYEGDYLTVDETFAMLDSCDMRSPNGLRNYCIIALLWSTGLRTGELLALQWRDIDLEEATVLVRNGKGRKQRRLFLNDRVCDDMRKYRKSILAGEEHPVFCSATPSSREDGAMGRHELSVIIGTAAGKAGIERRITPLTLRHTFATHMYEAGVAIRDIQEMMGHSQITETTVYVHVTVNAAKRLLNEHIYHTHYHQGEQL